MKLCIICYDLTDGGAQRVVSVLSNQLVRRHEICIITKERQKNEYSLDPRVRILTMDADEDFRKSRKKDLAAIPLLRRIFQAEQPDFVIPFLGFIEASYFATRGLSHVKYITTIRNSPWSKPEGRLPRFTRDLMVKLSDGCLLQNREQGTYFPERIRRKMFVVSNPVDPAYVSSGEHTYRPVKKLVTLGRLHGQKNHAMLIRAFGKIVPEVPEDVCLEIYGSGSKKEELEGQIREMGLSDRVRILPFQSNPIPIYEAADLFLLSSDFEGMPNALLEAMAMGLPCISTDCRTGPKDMIEDGDSGFLVPVGDSDAMAEKMLRLIREPELARKFGTAARARVLENYVTDIVIGKLEAELESRKA